MKHSGTWMVLLGNLCQSIAVAQFQILPDAKPQGVFAGNAQKVNTVWRSMGGEAVAGEIRLRLYQTTSSTAVPLEEITWKRLQILPGQTVLQSTAIDFPPVKAATPFLIQWVHDTNIVLGNTMVTVYPTNLLAELKPMLHMDVLGVLDPNSALKPSLKQMGIEFLNLDEMALDDFSGKLAIIGPFQTRAQMREGLSQSIQRIARKGVAVVWIQPPSKAGDELRPSFYVVPAGKRAVVIAQPELVADLIEKPQSQLNLIHFCQLALHPVPPTLPDFSAEP